MVTRGVGFIARPLWQCGSTIHPKTYFPVTSFHCSASSVVQCILSSAVLIILECCICCAASHLSYRSCVLGWGILFLNFYQQHTVISALSIVHCAVQCLFGAWGGFSRGGDTRALLPVHYTALQWWHTCAIRGEQQLSAFHQRPDIEATILLPDITSSSDRLERS